MAKSNLSLWEKVEKTPPKFTKQFNRGGGFKGTAINPTYLDHAATEHFGPQGIGWGTEVVTEEVLEGAPLLDSNGNVIGHEKVHKVLLKLWYVLDGKRGEVYQFGQTTFVGKNKNGFFTDEEAPKKSMTDAKTKCLSGLGFSADIFLGKYDDNKYVNNTQAEFDQLEEKMKQDEEREKLKAKMLDYFSTKPPTPEKVGEALAKCEAYVVEGTLLKTDMPEIRQAVVDRLKVLLQSRISKCAVKAEAMDVQEDFDRVCSQFLEQSESRQLDTAAQEVYAKLPNELAMA